MTLWNTLYESTYMGSWDLLDESGAPVPRTVTVTGWEIAEVFSAKKNGIDKLPVIRVKEFPLPFVCNKTNKKQLVKFFGPHIESIVGKRITLVARESDKSENGYAIRISNVLPRDAAPEKVAAKAQAKPAPPREPGAEG